MQLLMLNGIQIKQPQSFGYEKYNLTESGRTADGTMQMDLIAKKRKFTLKYDVLDGISFNTILSVIDTDAMFFELSYVETDITKTATVYVGSIKFDQFRTDGYWYYKNVTYDLIEA